MYTGSMYLHGRYQLTIISKEIKTMIFAHETVKVTVFGIYKYVQLISVFNYLFDGKPIVDEAKQIIGNLNHFMNLIISFQVTEQ